MASNVPPPTGKFFLVATIEAKDASKADKLQALLVDVQKTANSDAEPGTLFYNVTRKVESDGVTLSNTFLVIEQYENSAAHEHHRTTPAFQQLFANVAGLSNGADIVFYRSVL